MNSADISKGSRVETKGGKFGTVANVLESGLVVVRMDGGPLDMFRPEALTVIVDSASGATGVHYCEAFIEGRKTDRHCRNRAQLVEGFGWVCPTHAKKLGR